MPIPLTTLSMRLLAAVAIAGLGAMLTACSDDADKEASKAEAAATETAAKAPTPQNVDAITTAAAHDSVLTRAMSGRLARGLPNRAVRTIEESGAIAPFPAQNWLTGRFRAEAGRGGMGELQSLWLGQAAPLAVHDDARTLLEELARGIPA